MIEDDSELEPETCPECHTKMIFVIPHDNWGGVMRAHWLCPNCQRCGTFVNL